MQAVILASGRGVRMGTLTESVPKPMLEINGMTLLEYKLAALPEDVDEVIIVVGYLGSMIHNHFGGTYNDKRLFYVEQEKLNGTAGALWLCQDILKDSFIVLNADDIYSREDIEAVASHDGWAVLVDEVEQMNSGGCIVIDDDGIVQEIKEGNHEGNPGLMNTNVFKLDTRIFNCPLVPKAPDSEEFGLPQTVIAASQVSGISIEAIKATFWFQITEPADLAKMEEMLKAESTE